MATKDFPKKKKKKQKRWRQEEEGEGERYVKKVKQTGKETRQSSSGKCQKRDEKRQK